MSLTLSQKVILTLTLFLGTHSIAVTTMQGIKFDRVNRIVTVISTGGVSETINSDQIGQEGMDKLFELEDEVIKHKSNFGSDGSATVRNRQVDEEIRALRQQLTTTAQERESLAQRLNGFADVEKLSKLTQKENQLRAQIEKSESSYRNPSPSVNSLRFRVSQIVSEYAKRIREARNAARQYSYNNFKSPSTSITDSQKGDETSQQDSSFKVAGNNKQEQMIAVEINNLRSFIQLAIDDLMNHKSFHTSVNQAIIPLQNSSLKTATVMVKEPSLTQWFAQPGDNDPDKTLAGFLKVDNLVANNSELKIKHLPKMTVPGIGEIIDISYIYNLSEKILNRKRLTTNEVLLIETLFKNLSSGQYSRFFALVYGYQIHKNLENNLVKSILEYSSPREIKLLLLSKLSGSSDKTRFINILNADQAGLTELIYQMARETSNSIDIHTDIIVPLVFFKKVIEKKDPLEMRLLFQKINDKSSIQEMTRYAGELSYLSSQHQQVEKQRRLNNPDRYDAYSYLTGVTDYYTTFFKVEDAVVRVNSDIIAKLNLPQFFEEAIEVTKRADGIDYFKREQYLSKYSVEYRNSSSGRAGFRCEKYYY